MHLWQPPPPPLATALKLVKTNRASLMLSSVLISHKEVGGGLIQIIELELSRFVSCHNAQQSEIKWRSSER